MRNTYIENNDFKETLDNYLKHFSKLGKETIESKDSSNRVTYSAIYATVCDPTYNASAMDGIAVCSKDTLDATEIHPLTLKKDQYEYQRFMDSVNATKNATTIFALNNNQTIQK